MAHDKLVSDIIAYSGDEVPFFRITGRLFEAKTGELVPSYVEYAVYEACRESDKRIQQYDPEKHKLNIWKEPGILSLTSAKMPTVWGNWIFDPQGIAKDSLKLLGDKYVMFKSANLATPSAICKKVREMKYDYPIILVIDINHAFRMRKYIGAGKSRVILRVTCEHAWSRMAPDYRGFKMPRVDDPEEFVRTHGRAFVSALLHK